MSVFLPSHYWISQDDYRSVSDSRLACGLRRSRHMLTISVISCNLKIPRVRFQWYSLPYNWKTFPFHYQPLEKKTSKNKQEQQEESVSRLPEWVFFLFIYLSYLIILFMYLSAFKDSRRECIFFWPSLNPFITP